MDLINTQQHAARAAGGGDRTETIPWWGFTHGRLNPLGRMIGAFKAGPTTEYDEAFSSIQRAITEWIEVQQVRYIVRPLERRLRAWWRWRVMRWAAGLLECMVPAIVLWVQNVNQAAIAVKADAIQKDTNEQLLKLLGDHKSLRSFLFVHFPVDLEEADSFERPLLDVAKTIMLRAKVRS